MNSREIETPHDAGGNQNLWLWLYIPKIHRVSKSVTRDFGLALKTESTLMFPYDVRHEDRKTTANGFLYISNVK